MAILKIDTPCGFEARVDEDAMQDLEIYETVRAFYAAIKGGDDIPDLRGACAALLGEQGWNAFVAFEKKRFGKVRVDHVGETIHAVLTGLDSKKK